MGMKNMAGIMGVALMLAADHNAGYLKDHNGKNDTKNNKKSNNEEHQLILKNKKRKYKNYLLKKNVFKYTLDDIIVFARNDANAIRKFKKFGKTELYIKTNFKKISHE